MSLAKFAPTPDVGRLACLREGLFDWIEVRRIGRQEEELGLGGADGGANGAAFMASEVVHDDNVARREDREENLLDISAEACAIDWSVDDAGRGEPVATQRRQESERPPFAERRFGDERLPLAQRPWVRVMLVFAQSLPSGLTRGSRR